MKVSSSLNHKLLTYWDARVSAGYDELRNLAACAGIRGEIDAANRARWNHYGQVITRSDGATIILPPRRWVYGGLDSGDELTGRLATVIRERIKEAKPYSSRNVSIGRQTYHVEDRATAFGGTKSKANSPRMIMKAIADQIAANQRKIITSRTLQRNEPSTVKRKKGNMPMVWSGEMFSEIRGFVEEK